MKKGNLVKQKLVKKPFMERIADHETFPKVKDLNMMTEKDTTKISLVEMEETTEVEVNIEVAAVKEAEASAEENIPGMEVPREVEVQADMKTTIPTVMNTVTENEAMAAERVIVRMSI